MHFQSSTQWQRQKREACEEIKFYLDIVIFAFIVVTGACDPNMTRDIYKFFVNCSARKGSLIGNKNICIVLYCIVFKLFLHLISGVHIFRFQISQRLEILRIFHIISRVVRTRYPHFNSCCHFEPWHRNLLPI